MKILYLECGMGAAGDMLAAALFELLTPKDRELFAETIDSLGIPGVELSMEKTEKCGISGTHFKVVADGQEEDSQDIRSHSHELSGDRTGEDEVPRPDTGPDGISLGHEYYDNSRDPGDTYGTCTCHIEQGHHADGGSHEGHHHGGHHHTSLKDIRDLVQQMDVSERVKSDILAVYQLIAGAESTVHGVPVSEIHFHELGTMDALADISAVSILMEKINPDRVISSAVNTGSGHVKCAHGILPVPAPATALILRDIPIYQGNIKAELCTPTGAALIKHFADSFGPMPLMKTVSVGYGMGKKDFEAANVLRAFVGEEIDADEIAGEKVTSVGTTGGKTDDTDIIYRLECNVDDMTAEEIGFAVEKLMEEGALDVYTVPISMKKNRPGTLISLICRPDDKEAKVEALFKYTSTLGIREIKCARFVLKREVCRVNTPYGPVRLKQASGYGTSKLKYEYDDLSHIAREHGLSIKEVLAELPDENKLKI